MSVAADADREGEPPPAIYRFYGHPETRQCGYVFVGDDGVRNVLPEGTRPLHELPIADASKCAAVHELGYGTPTDDACAWVMQALRSVDDFREEIRPKVCELFGMDGGPLPVVVERCYWEELLPYHEEIDIPDYCGDEALALVDQVEQIEQARAIAWKVGITISASVLLLAAALVVWRFLRRRARARLEEDMAHAPRRP